MKVLRRWDKTGLVMLRALLSPLVILFYVVIIVLFADTVMSVLPVGVKLYVALLIFINTLLVPVIGIGLIRFFVRKYFPEVTQKKVLFAELIVVFICYLTCFLTVDNAFNVFIIKQIILGGLVCIALTITTSVFMKTDLGMVAGGAGATALYLITIYSLGNLMCWCLVLILAGGLNGSISVATGKSTPLSLAKGYIVGITGFSIGFLMLTHNLG